VASNIWWRERERDASTCISRYQAFAPAPVASNIRQALPRTPRAPPAAAGGSPPAALRLQVPRRALEVGRTADARVIVAVGIESRV